MGSLTNLSPPNFLQFILVLEALARVHSRAEVALQLPSLSYHLVDQRVAYLDLHLPPLLTLPLPLLAAAVLPQPYHFGNFSGYPPNEGMSLSILQSDGTFLQRVVPFRSFLRCCFKLPMKVPLHGCSF